MEVLLDPKTVLTSTSKSGPPHLSLISANSNTQSLKPKIKALPSSLLFTHLPHLHPSTRLSSPSKHPWHLAPSLPYVPLSHATPLIRSSPHLDCGPLSTWQPQNLPSNPSLHQKRDHEPPSFQGSSSHTGLVSPSNHQCPFHLRSSHLLCPLLGNALLCGQGCHTAGPLWPLRLQCDKSPRKPGH